MDNLNFEVVCDVVCSVGSRVPTLIDKNSFFFLPNKQKPPLGLNVLTAFLCTYIPLRAVFCTVETLDLDLEAVRPIKINVVLRFVFRRQKDEKGSELVSTR